MGPKTNEEWIAEFLTKFTYVRDILDDLDDLHNREFNGSLSDVSQVIKYFHTILTKKDKEKEEAVAEAYKRGYIQGGFDSEMNRLNVTPPTNR